MPSRRDQSLVRLRGWSGGLNADTSELLIEQNEVPSCLNVDFDIGGAIRKRKGYTKFSTSDPASMSYGTDIYHYRSSSGTDFLVYVDTDRELYYENISTGSTFARANDGSNISVNKANDAVSFDSVFYISGDGNSETTRSFDGSSWTNITDITLNDSGTEFPRARELLNQHERVFAFNLTENSGTFGSRIWFSEAGDADNWDSTSWIDVDPDDGTEIRDARSYGERIMIFKDDSVHILSGVDPLSFTLFKVPTESGTTARRTARVVEGILIWFDPDSGVWGFDGANVRLIDDPVHDRILDNLDDPSDGSVAYSAFVKEGKYYLGVPWTDGGGGSNEFPTRTFVLDVRRGRWSEYDMAWSSVVEVAGTYYGVGPSSGSTPPKGVFKLFDGDDDNGSDIDSYFETSWFAPEDGFIQQHRLRKMIVYVQAQTANPATLTVETYVNWDDATSSANESVTTDVTPSTDDFNVMQLTGFDLDTFDSWKIKISNDSDAAWQVDGIDILFSSRTTTRGDMDG